LNVRPATPGDAPAIAVIYAEHVRGGTGTFEEAPPSTADMTARMRAVLDKGFPWVVVEEEGRILAYAYAGPYHHRSAYRYTAEDSVYVAEHARGHGYGKAALAAVIDGCRAIGMRRLLGVIGDSGNAASVALHRSLGFQPCGTLPAVGYKAGKWLDVVLMHLPLNGGDETPPA
jgi:phosphinothricin acetyltransferase